MRAKRVIDAHMHHGLEKEAIDRFGNKGNAEVWWTGSQKLMKIDVIGGATDAQEGEFNWTNGVRRRVGAKWGEIPDYKAEHIIESMDEGRVTQGVLCGIDGVFTVGLGKRQRSWEWKVTPEYTKHLMDRFPGRFLGEVGVYPPRGEKEAMRELERGINEFGCCGMKIFTPTGFRANDPRAYPLYEKCIELGVHATIHTNAEACIGSRMSACTPFHIDDVANDFPDLHIHMLHMAVYLGMEMQALACLTHAPNMYTSCDPLGVPIDSVYPMSWVKRPDLFRVMEKIFPRRLMYGTDFPISYPHRESIEAIEGMDLSEEFRNLLFCDNARRFYKIK